jgi:hypothetical protein
MITWHLGRQSAEEGVSGPRLAGIFQRAADSGRCTIDPSVRAIDRSRGVADSSARFTGSGLCLIDLSAWRVDRSRCVAYPSGRRLDSSRCFAVFSLCLIDAIPRRIDSSRCATDSSRCFIDCGRWLMHWSPRLIGRSATELTHLLADELAEGVHPGR